MLIRQDDLHDPRTQALLRLHVQRMHANTPTEHVFALDLPALRKPDITVWTVWQDETILGIGALKCLDPAHGEVKSMRTHPDHLRKGVGAALLTHIVAVARARGVRCLSLETGRGPDFEPALALYRRFGFVSGPAFAEYVPSAYNQFLHLHL